MAILFVHDMSEMEISGSELFFNEKLEIQRELYICAAITTNLRQQLKLHICKMLCCFIINGVTVRGYLPVVSSNMCACGFASDTEKHKLILFLAIDFNIPICTKINEQRLNSKGETNFENCFIKIFNSAFSLILICMGTNFV